MCFSSTHPDAKSWRFAGFLIASTRLSTPVESAVRGPWLGDGCPLRAEIFSSAYSRLPCGQPASVKLVYTGLSSPFRAAFLLSSPREADLSAQRAQAEAEARLPSTHGNARRPRDPQAPPRERPQAALRLSSGGQVHRRNRLSRSRDFDAV